MSQMKKKRNEGRFKRRTIGFAVIASMVVSLIAPSYANMNAIAAGSHETSGFLSFTNTDIGAKETLTDNGDGTYTFHMELGAETFLSDANQHFSSVQDGYFTAPYDGEYLIDLWGGDGANGESTSAGEGGHGGAGAHLYGTISLNKGDVLYYSLGGHGQPTSVTDEGGGANGDGGGLGNIVTSSYKVGGGGGYSAVYLFDGEAGATGYEQFAADYLNKAGQLVPDDIFEADRLSRYIMIAGGGGGGGAGDGFSITGIFGGSSQPGRADGGNAGGYSSASGQITGVGIVNGTFYAGADGKSSGKSTAYIGHGGTNEPGQLADTITTIIKGVQPNDWFSTYNDSLAGGAGGAGDMRGGAGGAGYCGGSGGVMTAIVEADNVGGGGGGSSFVANSVSMISDAEKTAWENEGYIATSQNSSSDEGGQIRITFLEPANEDDVINEVNLQMPALSKYFELVGNITAVDAVGKELSVVEKDGCFTVSNAETIPVKLGDRFELAFTFKPIDGFAGGNDVPIFNQDTPTVAVQQVKSEGTGESTELLLDEKVCYVNVDMDFQAIAKSYMTNVPGTEYAVTELYDDKYAQLRQNLQADIRYDFISEIGTYGVVDEDGSLDTESTVKPQTTTKYTVSFDVTPKAGSKAIVGNVQSKTKYSDIATITVLEEGEYKPGDDTTIKYSKALEYDADTNQYVLSLKVNGTVTSVGTAVSKPEIPPFVYPLNEEQSDTFTVETPGYYLIQAWGGNGGNGGEGGLGTAGGAGGKGGYVYGYKYFSANESIKVDPLGVNGENGADGGFLQEGKGGAGGSYTRIYSVMDDKTLMIAGGGAGGNGGRLGAGASGNSSTVISETLQSLSEYMGDAGTSGGQSSTAGINYRHAELSISDAEKLAELADDAKDMLEAAGNLSATNNPSSSGGAVYITCIQVEDTTESLKAANENKLKDFSVLADISEYFAVVATDGFAGVEDAGNTWQFNNIKPTITHNSPEENNDNTITVTSTMEFTVSIPLKPVDNLIGGNDIPLLEETSAAPNMSLSFTYGDKEDVVSIPAKNETDYANVDISYQFDEDDLRVNDVTIIKDSVSLAQLKNKFYSSNVDKTGYIWTFAQDELTTTLTSMPDETSSYQVTLTVGAKAPSEKAVVKGTVSPISRTLEGTVYVDYSVSTENGSCLSIDNQVAQATEDYHGALKADAGYKLPASIEIKTADGRTVTDFTYNPKTGAIVIASETIASVKDNLIIKGQALPNTFSLIVMYKDLDGKTVLRGQKTYEAGTEIDPADCGGLFDKPECNPLEYDFVWANEDVEEALATQSTFTMPGNNMYVVGEFIPKAYELTVEYLDEAGNDLAAASTDTVRFGASYSVTAEAIAGHALTSVTVDGVSIGTPVVVTGTMPAADQNVTFVYKELKGVVKVSYIKRDTNEVIEEKEETVTANKAYSIVSPSVTGYTPELEVVEGTADANATGSQHIVYYMPNQYTVTFDPDGGSLMEGQDAKQVQYNQIFGYTAVAGDYAGGSYDGLPAPVKPGYKFVGWYTQEDALVTESSVVDITSDVTLTAKWEAETYKITVQFVDEDGNKVAENYSYSVAYDSEYAVADHLVDPSNGVSMPATGASTIYKEWKCSSNAAGTMPAQNLLVTVTYYFNSYDLLVNYYVVAPGGKTTKFWFNETSQVRYNAAYQVEKPFADAYAEHGTNWPDGVGSHESDFYPQQQVYTGTMPAENLIINYYYVTETPVVMVSVEWGELVYHYSRGTWNPETHLYEGDLIQEAQPDANYVQVTNHKESTIKVNAEFTYSCEDMDFAPLQPILTVDGVMGQAGINTVRKEDLGLEEADASTKVELDFSGYLWQNTDIPDEIPQGTPIPFGVLEVIITGGNPK